MASRTVANVTQVGTLGRHTTDMGREADVGMVEEDLGVYQFTESLTVSGECKFRKCVCKLAKGCISP